MGLTSLIDIISGKMFIFNKTLGGDTVIPLHDELDGLNDGDFQHLTVVEKQKLNNSQNKFTTLNIDDDVTSAIPYTIYIVDATLKPITINLPDANDDDNEYIIILEENTHKITIKTTSNQLISGKTIQNIPTVTGYLHLKSNNDHYDIVCDGRMLKSVREITTDRDFSTDGFENYIEYLCKPNNNTIVITLPEPSTLYTEKAIKADFVQIGDGTVVFTTVNGTTLIGDATNQILSTNNSGFSIIEIDGKYILSNDNRPKIIEVPVPTFPLFEDSTIIDPLRGVFFKQRSTSINDIRYDRNQNYLASFTVTARTDEPYQIAFSSISDEGIISGIIPEGIIDSDFYCRIVSGNRNISLYVSCSIRKNNGDEILIGNSNPIIISGNILQLNKTIIQHSGFTLESTDRIIFRVYVKRLTNPGADPIFELSIEGSAPSRSRIEVPINSVSHNTLTGLNVGNYQHLTQIEKNNILSHIIDYTKNNFKNVKSISDLPTPINNIINLAANTTYFINGNINIGDNIISFSNNCILCGDNNYKDIIISNRLAGMFISTGDVSLSINNIGIIYNNVGDMFNFVSDNNFIRIKDCNISCDGNIGIISGFKIASLEHLYISKFINSLKFIGSDIATPNIYSNVYVDSCFILEQTINNTIFELISGRFGKVKFWDNSVILNNNTKFLSVNSNVSLINGTINHGILKGNVFAGTNSGLNIVDGITQKTSGWYFDHNDGLPNSHISGYIQSNNNLLQTTISSIGSFVKLNYINSIIKFERTTISQNRITYTCTCTPLFEGGFIVSGSITTTSNNTQLRVGICKNNNNVPITYVNVFVPRANENISFSFICDDDITLNDYYEVWVANMLNTNPIIISDIQFKLNGDI